MKKIVSLVFTIVLVCAAFGVLVGCSGGGASDYVGTWVVAEVTQDGTTYSVDDLESLGISGEDFMTLELRSDGTCDITVLGSSVSDSSSTMTWTTTDSGISISADGSSMDAAYDSSTGYLTLEYEGSSVSLKKS
ncbi:MAG: hypothetical protein ACOYIK_05395 [Coriobacteriales bacterium]|jgi:hypothetical protein